MKQKSQMRKRILICILIVMIIGSNLSCRTKDKIKQKPVIGICFDSLVIERWLLDRDVFVSTATSLGAEVIVQNANGEVKKQIEQLEHFIDNKVDVIVIIATDTKALTDTIKKAKQAGIKIIAYDRLILDAEIDLCITFDSEKVGELMAECLNKKLDIKSKILTIFGSPTDSNVTFIEEGFQKKLDKEKIKVEQKEYANGWRSEVAFEKVSDYLGKSKKIEAVVCGNDDLASQAIRALSEKRLAGEVYVIGQDAELSACQRIVEGTQYATVYKDVNKMAKKAAKYAVKLANGGKLEVTETIFNGKFDIPYEKNEPILVTKENMEEVIILSGFHTKDEVYLNLWK